MRSSVFLRGQVDSDAATCASIGNAKENKLDEMIGVLQDILIDPEFVDMQSDFCLKNCGT